MVVNTYTQTDSFSPAILLAQPSKLKHKNTKIWAQDKTYKYGR